jgi:ketosteroid isomerase-like protein
MSKQDTEVFREATGAFNRGDPDAVLRCCHPEIEWHTTGRFADRRIYRGHDGVRQLIRELDEDLEALHSRIDDLREVKGRLISSTTLTGRGRRGGVPIELHLTSVVTLRQGKLLQVRQFARPEEALKAAGLDE